MNRSEAMLRPRIYNYLCSNGHGAQSDRELSACPAMTDGEPCDGVLRRYGPGSKRKATP